MGNNVSAILYSLVFANTVFKYYQIKTNQKFTASVTETIWLGGVNAGVTCYQSWN